ncbi:MAG: HypC/HybG/HupF family hydrogenase formation chaperone [Chitinispirillaceae bacterium]|nr:HypC/HybG/HupF family hydrogenase formation chaperone [Chitinispirillaceae bacterium]
MCLGIPGKVVWLREDRAGVDFGDVVVEAGTHIVEDLSVGDFVLVHSGYILEKLDLEEAKKTLAIFDELARVQQESK